MTPLTLRCFAGVHLDAETICIELHLWGEVCNVYLHKWVAKEVE